MKTKYYVYLLLLLLLKKFRSECARILVVMPTPSHSHNLVYRTIYKELCLRGHEVVAFTPDPLNDSSLTNLTEVDIGYVYNHLATANFETLYRLPRMLIVYRFQRGYNVIADEIFGHPKMQDLLQNPVEKFDLILLEWGTTPAFTLLSRRFNCPIIGMRSLGLRLEAHDAIANPTNPSYIPIAFMDFDGGFWSRLDNFVLGLMWRIHHNWFTVPSARKTAAKFFPSVKEDVLEIEKNVSLVLTNTHPVLTGVRPLVPSVIEVGGIHLKREKKKMHQDVQRYLDDSTEGVIYFNLGGTMKVSHLDPQLLNITLTVLASIPYKVVWKGVLPDDVVLPPNIRIWSWLPQEDILAHRHVKVFITHGGLLSFQEAVDNSVPILGIPFAADQFVNIRNVERLSIGRRLDAVRLTSQMFREAVLDVAENPGYLESIRKIRAVVKDQPMDPLEKAVWWIEYVLRHGGVHLKSAASQMDWISYTLTDVVLFLILCALGSAVSSYYFLKTIVSKKQKRSGMKKIGKKD